MRIHSDLDFMEESWKVILTNVDVKLKMKLLESRIDEHRYDVQEKTMKI